MAQSAPDHGPLLSPITGSSTQSPKPRSGPNLPTSQNPASPINPPHPEPLGLVVQVFSAICRQEGQSLALHDAGGDDANAKSGHKLHLNIRALIRVLGPIILQS